MAQSPLESVPPTEIGGYLKNWDALSSMIVRGRSFSGRERHRAFLNNGGVRFADASAAIGFDQIDDGRALAQCDWDGDGDLDLWITNRTAPRVKFLRNDLANGKGQNNWVSFSLEGTSCNRDAIGARLEITKGGKSLARTLSAGEGFMAQSSKRVFFGLGAITGDVSLAVKWPGTAEAEKFSAIAAGASYRIVQGSGTAEALPKRPPSALKALAIEPLPTTELARILLNHRVQAPSLEYVDFAGELQRFEAGKRGHATLINLWASWCAPCVAELADLKAANAELEANGVRVLAITAEAVGEDSKKQDLESAKALIAKENYPFEVGASDANALRLLTVLHNSILSRERPLPLPSSFLIDRHGKLAAIYRGPVSTAQIIADAALLEGAFPFKGSDGFDLFRTGHLDFARAYQEGGHFDDARREVQQAIDAAGGDRAALARAWHFTARLEQSERNWAAAVAAFEKAVGLAPETLSYAFGLARAHEQAGAPDQAVWHYDQLLVKHPNSLDAKNNLAWLLATSPDPTIRDGARALALAKAVNEAAGNENPNTLDTLAAAQAENGDFEAASASVDRAIRAAQAGGQLALIADLREKRERYRSGTPFRTAADQ